MIVFRKIPAVAAILGLGALAEPVAALTIEYLPDRAPALAACDVHRLAGRRADAVRCYTAVQADSADPRLQAEAARALGDPRSANQHFQAAIEQFPEDPGVRSRWAELFVETHQGNEAVKLFEESLALDSAYMPARLGLARIAAGRFDDKARAWAEEVLAAESRNIGAELLLARMSLEENALAEAEERLERAESIAERDGWTPLEIHALRASLDLLRGVTQSAWTARAPELNPGYGDIYATPAHFYVITRRYREAIELLQKAVDLEPDLYSAHAELGINLLRENRVAEARQHLELAYRGDPYSAPVVNTLRLIDSFDNFIESSEPASASSGGIVLKLHRDEDPILRPYVLDLVRDSIEAFAERYEFELAQPVVVELYPEHDDFAVRTSGLPGIGLLGVTFGYVVAMDSPSGRADNDFHWGTTLWHEMAHVFTLEATDHLVPRWFSEGVSVFEEWATGPLPGRQIPLNVLGVIREGRALPIAELDGGFIRPTYPNQIIVSYMQAGLACQFIADRWGQGGLVRMLRRFAAGDTTVTAIETALELSPEDFDRDFEQFVTREFGALFAQWDSWNEQREQMLAAAAAEDWPAVLSAADTVVAAYPDYVAEDSAWLGKARALQALEQRDEAMAALLEYRARGGHDVRALTRLASWLADSGRRPEAIEVLRDLLMVTPLNQQVHADLGDWLLDEGEADAALTEYQAYLAMNPHDQAAAHYRLATAYRELGEPSLTREHLLYALEIAPSYREAQQLLLEIIP